MKFIGLILGLCFLASCVTSTEVPGEVSARGEHRHRLADHGYVIR
jgi:hypothetical protein